MTTTTVTKPATPKAPKSQATKPAPTPEAKSAAAPRTNSAYADETTRAKVTEAMANLGEKGFTRPEISAHTGLTKGAVWRLQNSKAHADEVPTIEAFIARVLTGEVKPEVRAKAPNAQELRDRLERVTELLAAHDAQKTVTALRKLIGETLEVLNNA